MTDEKIARINELYKKAKEVGLNDQEKEEQSELRKEYVAAMKASLVANLENTAMIDEKGNKTKLSRKQK